jgi:NAD(P)H-nitrite reductase large subunit
MWQSPQYFAQPCTSVPHNTDLARTAGPYADNDIAVDGSLWTTATDILAAGDC